MDGWFGFAVMAFLMLGIQRFLYKVSAEKGCNSAWTSFSFMGTVAVLSSVFFLLQDGSVEKPAFLMLIALINSLTFLAATLSNMEALKRIPAGIAYPMIRLNAALVVVFSIFYFKDTLSRWQGLGIIVALCAVVFLARDHGENDQNPGDWRLGLLFIAVSIFSGAVAAVSSKFAALHVNKMAFMAISYTLATFFSLGFRNKLNFGNKNGRRRDALVIGVMMGLINLGGFYSYLKALTTGPLSVVTSITAMHFVIAIVFSALIYKEKLNRWRAIGIGMTIVSVILLRL